MDKQQPVVVIQGRDDWLQIEAAAQYAVVQIYAQVAKFNWLEPYKVEAQYENRGTGFFINEQGYLVTNAHVVAEAKTVWIQMPALGREIIHAEIVGFCPQRDLALIKVTPDALEAIRKQLGGIPFLFLGNSDVVRRTDNVMVLGYPLGSHRLKSVTGVVSGRESVGWASLMQITAPINPGSSGGPVISQQGQVIGVAESTMMHMQNIGYAIPVNELNIVLEDFLKVPLLRKPLLGVQFHNATDDQATFLGNPSPAGLYVQKVFKGLLVDQAGIQPGDMLYQFNGYRVDAFGETVVPWSTDKVSLRDLIARLTDGEKVSLVVYRQGKKIECTLVYDQSSIYPVRVMYPGYDTVDYEVIGGMVVMALADNHAPLLVGINPDLVELQKLENKSEPRLIITNILPGSCAQQLRCLLPGVILKEVNGESVRSLDEFRQAVHKSVETDFLSVKTHNDVLAVFSFKKMLADEPRLAKDFVYPISKTVQKLRTLVGHGKETT